MWTIDEFEEDINVKVKFVTLINDETEKSKA